MIHVRQIKNDLFYFLSSNRISSSSPPLFCFNDLLLVHQSTLENGVSYETSSTTKDPRISGLTLDPRINGLIPDRRISGLTPDPFLRYSNFPSSAASQSTFPQSFGQPSPLNVLSPPTTPIKSSPDSNTFPVSPFESKSDRKLMTHPHILQKNPKEEKDTFVENFKKSKNKKRKFDDDDHDDRSRESDNSSSTEMSKFDDISKVDEPSSEFVLTEDRSKRFGCPHSGCDYKSNRKNNLQRHKETMHHARAVAFNCCSLRFYRRAGKNIEMLKEKFSESTKIYNTVEVDKRDHFSARFKITE